MGLASFVLVYNTVIELHWLRTAIDSSAELEKSFSWVLLVRTLKTERLFHSQI